MLSIPIVHHVYSSVGGYKTIYSTQDPAAERIQKALVAVANTAYKGGMGATFRGYLRYQLPVPEIARPTLTAWQLPAAVALGNGWWYLKSFPMGTDHVGRPRACVHSMVILPERINPPAWWQPRPLAQMETAMLSNYDFPAEALFLHGRDSLQGLRERTRDQYPWQPQEFLNRAAGLAWLAAGNLPPALVGSILRLLLFPGARLFLLAPEAHAMFLARQLECVLPGSYRRQGGLLLGPHQRYIVPPLCPPNLIQIERPNEYPAGECLVDLTSAPPRWIGPEPPTSPLAAQILDYFNRGDLAGLLRFIEMWDLLDEMAPTPNRQTGGLAAMTSLKLLAMESGNQPWPDWTQNPAACASALPFLIQAGWRSAHDVAWQVVKTALQSHPNPAARNEIAVWETYVTQVRGKPAGSVPTPAIRAIIQALEAPSHSAIIAAIDDAMLDDTWMDDSSHKIPVIAPADENAEIPEELAIAPDLDTPDDLEDTDSEITLLPGTETGIEVDSETMEIDAEFALPGMAGATPGGSREVPQELETVQENWAPQAEAQAALIESAHAADSKKKSGSGTARPAAKPPPRISSALEAKSGSGLRPVGGNPAAAGGDSAGSSTLIGALEGDGDQQALGTASSSMLLVAADEESTPDGGKPAGGPAKKPARAADAEPEDIVELDAGDDPTDGPA